MSKRCKDDGKFQVFLFVIWGKQLWFCVQVDCTVAMVLGVSSCASCGPFTNEMPFCVPATVHIIWNVRGVNLVETCTSPFYMAWSWCLLEIFCLGHWHFDSMYLPVTGLKNSMEIVKGQGGESWELCVKASGQWKGISGALLWCNLVLSLLGAHLQYHTMLGFFLNCVFVCYSVIFN